MPNSDPSHSTYTSMMHLKKNGRPFAKDLYDMFAAVIMQIKLTDHRILFRTYPYTFTTDEATTFKKSFQFIHIDHTTDAQGRQVSTRTTTTFSMDTSTARTLLQYFLDARLIHNITDPTSEVVTNKALWRPTPKGKCVLMDFSQETQVKLSPALLTALESVGSCRLIHLDRLHSDDQLTFCRANMMTAFKGMTDNLTPDTLMLDDIGGIEKRHLAQYEHSYVGTHCVDWISDNLTVSCKGEGEAIAAEFVLCGWLAQVLDKSDKSLNRRQKDVSFKTTRNAIYHVTNRGCLVVGWKPVTTEDDASMEPGVSIHSSSSSSNTNKKSVSTAPPGETSIPEEEEDRSDVASTRSSIDMTCEELFGESSRPPSMTLTDSSMSRSSTNSSAPQEQHIQKKDVSQWARLFHILETPLLRMYFRDFLRANYCVENINFWVDHNHLLKHLRHNTRSQLELLSECYCIYETYIGPKATADVNIDHSLLQDIIKYVNTVFTVTNKIPSEGVVYFLVPASAGVARSAKPPRQLLVPAQIVSKKRIVLLSANLTVEKCLMKLIKMLGRVTEHVCRIMAEDSVPKFAKTEKYKELMRAEEEEMEMNALKNGMENLL